MSADDQVFLDVLNSVGSDVKRFSGDVAGYIERHVEQVAASLREGLASQGWLPESMRPSPPVFTPSEPSKVIPAGLYHRITDWILENKLLTGTFVIGLTTTATLVHRSRRAYAKKRRAKKGTNGARLEVVVIAGSPSEPIVRSLAQDLERRGFVVFIVCNDVEEEIVVQNESRADIKPLSMDISRPHDSIERFTNYLRSPQHAFHGARPHQLVFSSLIIVPSFAYPTAPLATISASAVSDLLNTRLLQPILLTQAFLPLLSSLPLARLPHSYSVETPADPKILLLTPAVIPSLNPAFHIPESTVTAALTCFVQALKSELEPQSIPVYHLKLGTFDTSALQPKTQLQTLQATRADTLSWPEGARELYGENFMRMIHRGGKRSGSPLRELHNTVFDLIEENVGWWRRGRTIHVGKGSGIYSFIGNWAPRGLVGWMMGMQKVQRTVVTENYEDDASERDYVSVYQRPDDRDI